MTRKILVTSALPYANGAIHLGHLVEYIQTDIWVRFQKMRGHQCWYVCADDTHGTPIMLRAEKEGITPEALIERVHGEHTRDFAGFHVGFDNYYTTHSEETRACANEIYARLQAAGLIETRTIEQYYDPVKQMFLPDRFIKGECPKCGAHDQYGDNCESCGAAYTANELKNPYSAVSGARPELRQSEHFFFRLSDPRCQAFLRRWTQGEGRLQNEAANKLQEWLGSEGDNRLTDWDISRDSPYFGFEIPDAPGKYFYVWLDAPIGYMGAFRNLCARRRARFRRVLAAGFDHRAVSLHRQGHPLLPCAVLAGGTRTRRLPYAEQGLRARLPDRRWRQDVQVARHLHHRRKLPGAGPRPRVAALLLCCQALGFDGGHRPQPRRFHRPRQFRPGRQVREHRQPFGGLHRQTLRRPAVHLRRIAAGDPGHPRTPCGDRRSLRSARVRQGDPRDHGPHRPRQSVRRQRQALGTGPPAGSRAANCRPRAATR
jgi:hypothetical protein